MTSKGRILVAVGGNSLAPEGEQPSLTGQQRRADSFAHAIADLIKDGWNVCITHGNGPQVGYILRRGELVATRDRTERLPDLPLWLAVADSQGGLGHILTVALDGALRRLGINSPAACLLTHVEVDPADPAFRDPTKPIGGVMTGALAEVHQKEDGWVVVRTGPDAYRRVVPSPRPVRVLEAAHVRTLLAAGALVVAGGGGGIPIHADESGAWVESDAVIDKDRTSALLAAAVEADALVLVTGVPAICTGFGTPEQKRLDHLTVDEARALLAAGEFPPGSMGPKVSSAIDFAVSGRGDAIVTSIDHLADALAGLSGTRITATSKEIG